MNWLLRFFFTHFYTTIAFSYDFVADVVSIGQWKDWIAVAIESIPAGRVLEIGHGPGHLQLMLNEDGFTPFGLDASGQMVRMASRRILQAGSDPRISRGLAAQLPFPAETFAGIVSTFPTEYIADESVVGEIFRTLQLGGVLTIVPVAYINSPLWIDRIAAGLFRITGQAPPPSPDWGSTLSAHGFDTIVQEVELPRARVIRIVARKVAA